MTGFFAVGLRASLSSDFFRFSIGLEHWVDG
jgi:hypothetical protein